MPPVSITCWRSAYKAARCWCRAACYGRGSAVRWGSCHECGARRDRLHSWSNTEVRAFQAPLPWVRRDVRQFPSVGRGADIVTRNRCTAVRSLRCCLTRSSFHLLQRRGQHSPCHDGHRPFDRGSVADPRWISAVSVSSTQRSRWSASSRISGTGAKTSASDRAGRSSPVRLAMFTIGTW